MEVWSSDMDLLSLAAFGAFVAISNHTILFRHGEWHLKAPEVLQTHFLIVVAALLGSACYGKWALRGTFFTIVSYFATLFSQYLSLSTYIPSPLAGWVSWSDTCTSN